MGAVVAVVEQEHDASGKDPTALAGCRDEEPTGEVGPALRARPIAHGSAPDPIAARTRPGLNPADRGHREGDPNKVGDDVA